ncbi:hypothetical protein A2U01_0035637, partial [Trifolium medium]|nr:hypothetical protein [Trifolium medium]
ITKPPLNLCALVSLLHPAPSAETNRSQIAMSLFVPVSHYIPLFHIFEIQFKFAVQPTTNVGYSRE